jgi:UDP-N-acetylglucosamine--dolichyl-phosphate N-acetylglucosaminephosphotransferase
MAIAFESFIASISFMLLVFFLLPASFMFFSLPHIIRKLKERGFVVKDMYKKDLREVPTNGGLVILLISMFSMSLLSLFYYKYIPFVNYIVMIVVVLFALFGLLDDLIDIGRAAKLILLYYCAYSLIPFASKTTVLIPFIGAIDFEIVYLQLIVPTYVPVVANLINMHSGYNGLASGLSLIILGTLILKSYYFGNILNALFGVCLMGALASFYWFNKYPSRIFEGNVGALTIGAAIGALIVMQDFVVSGFIMLLPHTVNFLLYVYWRLRIDKYPFQKFGRVREDGTLEVPNPLTLKWVLPYYFRVTEREATLAMYGLTAIFCVIGFYIPG